MLKIVIWINSHLDTGSSSQLIEKSKKDPYRTGSPTIHSPNTYSSPKKIYETKNYRTIKMVTSTPLVKSTEPTKNNPTNLLKPNEGTNSLFNAGASVVKHYPSDLRQDRILLTSVI